MTEPTPQGKQCPDCGKTVNTDASLCRHCGYIFLQPTTVIPRPTVANPLAPAVIPQLTADTALAWKPPSQSNRLCSAIIDGLVWFMVYGVVFCLLDYLAHNVFGIPAPTPNRLAKEDIVRVLSGGPATLCANLYLAIANRKGKSIGKALTRLRLVVFVGQYPARPGFARGLVRSAVQSFPFCGCWGVLIFTGVHDGIAGTKVIQPVNPAAWDRWWACSASSLNPDAVFPDVPRPPRIAIWKIALAILFHLFSAMASIIGGAM